MPATRDGVSSDPASSVMLSAEVLEPMIAPAGASCSICANSASLRSIFSGAASITRSASCERLGETRGRRRSRASIASASPAVTLPSSTPFLTICSMAPRPLPTAASDTS